jgi:ribosome biogenesis protein MAK21
VSSSHILNHEPLTGKPDLTIHTLSHFLDRFIYRNAKAAGVARGTSIMQPLAGSDSHDLLVSASGIGGDVRMQEPLNSEAFWRKRTEDVAAEDVFFHEYFNRLSKEKATKKDTKKAKDPVDRDEEAGSDDEDEIWQALVESRPGLEDDEDDDLDMDDLESAFDDDDEEDVEGLDDGEGVIFNDESDQDDEEEEEEEEAADDTSKRSKSQKKPSNDEEDEDEDDFDMDVSDDEAFRDSDEDLPSDLDVDMDGGVALPSTSADQDDDKKAEQKKKKRKLRNLPMFASVDDYAALLADEDDGQA